MSNDMTNIHVAAGGWDLVDAIENFGDLISDGGAVLVLVIGLIIMIWAAITIAKALMSRQGGTAEWVKGGVGILVGGAFIAGGWELLQSLGEGGTDTIKRLGE